MIRRPVRSWSSSAFTFGGYRRLIWLILKCYAGRHTRGHAFFMSDMSRGLSCQVCGKRLN